MGTLQILPVFSASILTARQNSVQCSVVLVTCTGIIKSKYISSLTVDNLTFNLRNPSNTCHHTNLTVILDMGNLRCISSISSIEPVKLVHAVHLKNILRLRNIHCRLTLWWFCCSFLLNSGASLPTRPRGDFVSLFTVIKLVPHRASPLQPPLQST